MVYSVSFLHLPLVHTWKTAPRTYMYTQINTNTNTGLCNRGISVWIYRGAYTRWKYWRLTVDPHDFITTSKVLSLITGRERFLRLLTTAKCIVGLCLLDLQFRNYIIRLICSLWYRMFQHKINHKIFILKKVGVTFWRCNQFSACWTWKCNYTIKAVVWLFPCCFSQWQYNSCGRVSQQEDLSSLDIKTQQESAGSPERNHQPADSIHTDWTTISISSLPRDHQNDYTHTSVYIYKQELAS